MDSGLYAVSTALVSRTQALDTIANNLANASTMGFRAEHNVFSSVLASKSAEGNSLNQVMNSYGILSGTTVDRTQGALEKTGNDLDVGISGPGFFEVQTADGPKYTRNGAFQVATNGQLVTASGDAVMGQGGVINIVPGQVSISSDGTISSKGAISGKIRLVEFEPGTQITSSGNGYYSAPAQSVVPAAASSVSQGVLESSNVNTISCMVELVNAQRTAEMMQRALSMFSSEINKTATQDLPKVG